jgi:hypothetical protein
MYFLNWRGRGGRLPFVGEKEEEEEEQQEQGEEEKEGDEALFLIGRFLRITFLVGKR